MTIIKTKTDGKLELALQGRLNVNSVTELNDLLDSELDGVTELVFDFSELEFISSAGIRVIAAAQKRMAKQGSMKIRKPNNVVSEIFNMTGLSKVFTIEE